MSQTRSKVKDHVHWYLHKIVPDIVIPAGPINDKAVKQLQAEALCHLVMLKEYYLYNRHSEDEVCEGKKKWYEPFQGSYL